MCIPIASYLGKKLQIALALATLHLAREDVKILKCGVAELGYQAWQAFNFVRVLKNSQTYITYTFQSLLKKSPVQGFWDDCHPRILQLC
jgi:hypothetical protein